MKINRNILTHLVRGLVTSAIVVVAWTGFAADDSFDRLVSRWKIEREQIMKRMTQSWLQGEKPEALKGDLLALSQIETGLATKPGAVLYLGAVENTHDLNATIGEVVRAYLRHRGGTVNSSEFLRGKTFNVLKEEIMPTPAEPSAKKKSVNSSKTGLPKELPEEPAKTSSAKNRVASLQ